MNAQRNLVEKFKKLILEKAIIKFERPTKTEKKLGNIKLGYMGSWAELAGDCTFYIPQLDMLVKGTCGEHCQGCFNPDNPRTSDCYVFKSYMKYTNKNEDGTVGDILKNKCCVKLGHAYRTLAMRFFKEDLFIKLDGQLTREEKREKPDKIIRGNESGELESFEDLEFWCNLFAKHPDLTFYLYTKNYAAVRKAIAMDIIPSNVFINISIWHEYGISEYLEFSWHPQIKAFAVVDDEWTREVYTEHGLVIEHMCGAYDSKGKMNHNVTCDKCQTCCNYKFKVQGCYKH